MRESSSSESALFSHQTGITLTSAHHLLFKTWVRDAWLLLTASDGADRKQPPSFVPAKGSFVFFQRN